MEREFRTEVLLSVVTGVCGVDVVDIYDLVAYVFEGVTPSNYTNYLGRLATHILTEHPSLTSATYIPSIEASYSSWVDSQKHLFGETIVIKPVTYLLEAANNVGSSSLKTG